MVACGGVGMTSFLRFLLWTFSIALTVFVGAMSVSPQGAITNVTSWLTFLGLAGSSAWFEAHARHRVHLSPETATQLVSRSAHSVSGGPSLDVPDVVLYALGALVVTLLILWITSRWRTVYA